MTGPSGPSGPTGPTGLTGETGGFQTLQNIVLTGDLNYLLLPADVGKLIVCNNSVAINIYVASMGAFGPAGIDIGPGANFDIVRVGTGSVTVVPYAQTVLDLTFSPPQVNSAITFDLRAQYSAGSLIHATPDNWILVGDLG
jgi:hypothetical protein